jgi:hypothetical protein
MPTTHNVIERVLDWLQNQDGDTWQGRWLGGGGDSRPRDWHELAGISGPQQVRTAQLLINALVILRVITPTLEWLLGMSRLRLRDDWTIYHDTEAFAALREKVGGADSADRAESIAHLYRMSVTTGRGLPDLTAADFCATRAILVRLGKRNGSLSSTWRHLKFLGFLGNDPAELAEVLAKPRLTPTELVGRYGVRDDGMRRLFVEYLTEREAGCDYTTLRTIALHVVRLFWGDLEEHEPGIRSLALSTEHTPGSADYRHSRQVLRGRTGQP